MIIRLTTWLYQGDFRSVHSGEYKNHKIGAIICVSENNERAFPVSDQAVHYLWCPLSDPGENLTAKKLSAMINFAREFKDDGVLVHCAGGVNRSPAMCALLLCSMDGMTEEQVCSLIREKNSDLNIRAELSKKIHDLTGKSIGNPR